MTQQYIAGELSLLVAELEQARDLGEVMHSLRREIESSPPGRLGPLAREALDLSDAVCWRALEAGDVPSFRHGTVAAASLWEFAASANLLS